MFVNIKDISINFNNVSHLQVIPNPWNPDSEGNPKDHILMVYFNHGESLSEDCLGIAGLDLHHGTKEDCFSVKDKIDERIQTDNTLTINDTPSPEDVKAEAQKTIDEIINRYLPTTMILIEIDNFSEKDDEKIIEQVGRIISDVDTKTIERVGKEVEILHPCDIACACIDKLEALGLITNDALYDHPDEKQTGSVIEATGDKTLRRELDIFVDLVYRRYRTEDNEFSPNYVYLTIGHNPVEFDAARSYWKSDNDSHLLSRYIEVLWDDR